MDEEPSRAELRNQSRRRTRLILGIGAGALVIAIIAIALIATGGGDNGTDNAQPSTTLPAKTSVSLQLGTVTAESAGAPAQVTPEQSQAIMKVVGDYLNIATVTPLRSAKRAASLKAVFDLGALVRASDVDRAVLLDEGLPKVTGNLDVVGQPVGIVALADKDGAIVLATATIDLDIKGVTAVKGAEPLHILRKGDLVLAPDASGAWKVTAFNVVVARTGAGLDPTTTTVPTSTTQKGAK